MNRPLAPQRLAPRLRGLSLSPNAAASQRAERLRGEGRAIINLTIGEPDFDTPQHIKDAAAEAMRLGRTKYPPTAGTASLRSAVADKLRRENRLDYPIQQIVVANGGKQIIHNALVATLQPGEEVIVPAPSWPSFPAIAIFAGGQVVSPACPPETAFKLGAEALERVLTPKTRWLVLNSPHNPTGAIYSAAELADLAEVLRRHPQVLIVADEIYEHVYFTEQPPASLTAIAPDLLDRILLVTGVSKTYAMTGWRIGFGAGPKWLIEAMIVVQSLTTSGACSISQAAAEAALIGDQSFVAFARDSYRQRRDLLSEKLPTIDGFSFLPPDGGFFALPGCAGLFGRKTPEGSAIHTDHDFVDYLLEEEGVAIVDGTSFELPGFLRLSLAASTDALSEACLRIARAVGRLSPPARP
jgi:aspartate aminotransferase